MRVKCPRCKHVHKAQVTTRLQGRQERFCIEYAKNGGNGTQAARAAGYSTTTEGTLATQAHRLLKRAKIKNRIAELMTPLEDEAEAAIRELLRRADAPGPQHAAARTALQRLGLLKVHHEHHHRHELEAAMTPAELIRVVTVVARSLPLDERKRIAGALLAQTSAVPVLPDRIVNVTPNGQLGHPGVDENGGSEDEAKGGG